MIGNIVFMMERVGISAEMDGDIFVNGNRILYRIVFLQISSLLLGCILFNKLLCYKKVVKMILKKMNFKPSPRSPARNGAASRWLCLGILCHGSLETLYLTEYLTQHVFSYGVRAALSSFSLPI